MVISNKDLWVFCLAEVTGKNVHENGRSSCSTFSVREVTRMLFATEEELKIAREQYHHERSMYNLDD